MATKDVATTSALLGWTKDYVEYDDSYPNQLGFWEVCYKDSYMNLPFK